MIFDAQYFVKKEETHMHGIICGRNIYADSIPKLKRQASRIANQKRHTYGKSTDYLIIACDKGRWEYTRECLYIDHTFSHGDWIEVEAKSYSEV